MSLIFKFLSYFVPIRRRYYSQIHGMIEVSWENGRKVVNSLNANQSYGLLLKVLEKSLDKINFSNVKKILLLGMGGGSIIRSLVNTYKFTGHITAVDSDEMMIQIANKEFGIVENERLLIIHQDAVNFITFEKEMYDLIIVDLFIDHTIPMVALQDEFCEQLLNRLTGEGKLVFNLGLNSFQPELATRVIHFFSSNKKGKAELIENVAQWNTVLLYSRTDTY